MAPASTIFQDDYEATREPQHQAAVNNHGTIHNQRTQECRSLFRMNGLLFRVVRDVGNKFGTVKEAMHRSFLPSLLKVTLPDNDPLHRLAALPVKSAGRALTDPVESADANFRAREVTNYRIIQVMRGKEINSFQDNRATTSKFKAEIKKQKEATHVGPRGHSRSTSQESLVCHTD
jgi:hypothetical protein